MATYKEIKGVTVQALDEDPVTDVKSWTSGGTMNTGRAGLVNGSTGSSSSASLAFGGNPDTGKTEEWNGAGWAEVADLSTARYDTTAVGAGTTSDNLAIGGNTAPAQIADTEVWSGSTTVTKTVGTD